MSQSSSLKDPSALTCAPIPGQPSEQPRPAHHYDRLDRLHKSHSSAASKHAVFDDLAIYRMKKRREIIYKIDENIQLILGWISPQKPEI
jgi:hypothetical protein